MEHFEDDNIFLINFIYFFKPNKKFFIKFIEFSQIFKLSLIELSFHILNSNKDIPFGMPLFIRS